MQYLINGTEGEVDADINNNRDVGRWGDYGCNYAKSSTGKQWLVSGVGAICIYSIYLKFFDLVIERGKSRWKSKNG